MHLLPADSVRPAGDVAAVAERLCGEPVRSVDRCGGGGNNRVYRVGTSSATYALKCYAGAELDNRDRLVHEFDGLRFLKACGIGSELPTALAADRAARSALYEWIDGTPVSDHGSREVEELVKFVGSLHEARAVEGAAALPFATEAVLQSGDLLDQIERRVVRLEPLFSAEPELSRFVENELRPELARRFADLQRSGCASPVPRRAQTLSPSDLGFHNALRRPDGGLAFIDLEYFGWDDPVKLTSDFLWHPAMELAKGERERFLAAMGTLYAGDTTFQSRLAVYYPLYGMRWALIMLNEFLPGLWERRKSSGKGGDWGAVKSDQLRKSRAKLGLVRTYLEGSYT